MYIIKLVKRIVPERSKQWYRTIKKTLIYPRGFFLHVNKNLRNSLFSEQEKMGFETIPIFIISYNRLSYVKNTIDWLERMKVKNPIFIIDNYSSYPPLLEYYKTIHHEVIYLDDNYGHLAFWRCEQFEQYRNNFYIVTDPDIEPVEDCPLDFIEQFFYALWKYPNIRKVGFSLKIDDLPDTNIRDEIIAHESQYYTYKIMGTNLYVAEIDTTMALYIPDSIVYNKSFLAALRTGYPYQARHLPWYKSRDDITQEDRFYSNTRKNGWWDVVEQKMTPD